MYSWNNSCNRESYLDLHFSFICVFYSFWMFFFLQLEKARGQTVSNMFCYMQKYGVSEEDATRGLQKEVIRLWKDMNKSVLRPNPVPRPVLQCIIGTVQAAHEYYTERDGDMYTESKGRMSQLVASLLRDTIPIWKYSLIWLCDFLSLCDKFSFFPCVKSLFLVLYQFGILGE